MTRMFALTAVAALLASPALADDDLGAYLYKTDCGSLSKDAIVSDIGDLDKEDDASKEWARLSASGEAQPNPIWAEDEGVDEVTTAQISEAGYSVAVHAKDSKDAEVIACGPVQGTVPFTADLAEVGGSGFVARVAVEADDDGIRLTTGAFKKAAAN